MNTTSTRTAYRICPICEAGCGLKITLDGTRVVRIRGNDDDVFSEGHLCPKGVALAALHDDPLRIREPKIRDARGERVVSWEAAFAEAGRRLADIRATCGNDAIAVYVGNPTAHNVGLSMGLGVFAGQLGSKNFYTAGSVDQIPKQLASELLFGDDMAAPVPDIVRTDCLVIIGANPVVSNGSFWMVPKIREKLRALRQRGGSLTVIDPRRSETARLADVHLAIRPAADAWLLIGLVNLLAARGRTIPARYAVRGREVLLASLRSINLDEVLIRTGISESALRELVDRLCAAKRPVLYGRIGTTLQAFGTLTSFLLEVVNLQLGATDTEGGALFGEQPFTQPHKAGPAALGHGRWHSRVSSRPEVGGQLPVAVLAEEIETAGPGQIRALVCFGGNPVLSNPDSERLRNALGTLECIVAVDIFDTTTAAMAHVLLPGTSPFEEGHYDYFLGGFGWKNVARYTPPVTAPDNRPDEWALCLQLAHGLRTGGQVASASELAAFEDEVVAGLVGRHVDDPNGSLHGRDVQEILGRIGPARGVERLLDVGIRAGRYGDAFGVRDGLTLERIAEAPDGIEIGALRPRLGEVIRHVDGRIDLAPAMILAEIERLKSTEPAAGLVLIGRRNVKTNNSWLHGISGLDQGVDVCVLEMHADDALVRGISDGDRVRIFNATGGFEVKVTVGNDLLPGVVALPHGFERANYNSLAEVNRVDEPSGTSALNGIRVEVERCVPVA
jgi:anaerobic selenocysteine-containing dehydrogenase